LDLKSGLELWVFHAILKDLKSGLELWVFHAILKDLKSGTVSVDVFIISKFIKYMLLLS
jgi:hypothetical protein